MVVDVLEVIGGLAMPPLLFLQLVLLSKVSPIVIVHEGYSARTSIRYGKEHVQDTFFAKQLGYSSEPVLPSKVAMGARDWLIMTF